MTSVETLLTAEQFASLPAPEEGGKMELVEGRVVCMAPVGEEHGDRAGRIHVRLWLYVEEHKLGVVGIEVGYRLSDKPDTVRAPDVSFVSHDMLNPNRDRSRYIEGPPTLAIEVVSPGDTDTSVSTKVVEYLEAGAHRVWIVRPANKTVTVHRPGGDSHTFGLGDTLASEDASFAVEGFHLPLAELFV